MQLNPIAKPSISIPDQKIAAIFVAAIFFKCSLTELYTLF